MCVERESDRERTNEDREIEERERPSQGQNVTLAPMGSP